MLWCQNMTVQICAMNAVQDGCSWCCSDSMPWRRIGVCVFYVLDISARLCLAFFVLLSLERRHSLGESFHIMFSRFGCFQSSLHGGGFVSMTQWHWGIELAETELHGETLIFEGSKRCFGMLRVPIFFGIHVKWCKIHPPWGPRNSASWWSFDWIWASGWLLFMPIGYHVWCVFVC